MRFLFGSGLLLGFAATTLVSCAHHQIQNRAQSPAEIQKEEDEKKAIQKLPGDPAAAPTNEALITSIPVYVNSEVEKWINYFQGRGRGYFERYLERSSKYMPLMRKILKENGVAEDLVYVAMIESGFSGKVKSRARAVGFWQFIGGTGKHYGLRVNKMVDERYDPVRSTEAAANYFKGLYNLFWNWYLAIASYNVGENRIKNLVMTQQTRDFWKLAREHKLPRETQDYIPKFFAAGLIARQPEEYGFSGLNYEDPMEFDVVTCKDSVDMAALAKSMKIGYREMKDLNPAWKTQYVVAYDGEAKVRVPVGMADAAKIVLNDAIVKNKRFLAMAQETSPSKISFTRHRVKRGETLEAISERFDVSPDEILRVNHIRRKRVRPGITLKIPSSAFNVEKENRSIASIGKRRDKLYTVRRGDTLIGIARRHHTTVDAIRKENRIAENSKVMRGQKIFIP